MVEELFSSRQFRNWFLTAVARKFDVPQIEDIRLEKSPRRLQDSRQTDVRLGWFDVDNELAACVLIENKVTSDFQPGQVESYASEVSEYRARLGTRSACAILIAPKWRLESHQSDVFDACIGIEEIIEFLQKRRDEGIEDEELDGRIAARISLLEAICGKRQGDLWTPITVPEKRSFSEEYAALAVEVVPGLTVKASSDGPKALTKTFEGLSLPDGFPKVKLKHEYGSSEAWKYANIQFTGLRTKLGLVQKSGLLEGTDFDELPSGKSLFIRGRTPGIDPRRSFGEQRGKVLEGLQQVKALADWIIANAESLKRIFTPQLEVRPAAAYLDREQGLRQALMRIYQECAEFGYRPARMLELMERRGAIGAAKYLIAHPVSDGFTRLAMEDRLDLAIESLALDEQWSDIFSEEEKTTARQRLRRQ
ncbi:PD-(D/E)XK nuclease family protein [Bradyrhizobium hipponense]|uniref:PD-(D/E)XK nuclease family protein n=1 Tax=Bradyrhizobium hipponense TaxID=2605638 RepID=UPI0016533D19|nr:PD-(D/E)XK nuclease family protein [Bradyrhizobium hipponense]